MSRRSGRGGARLAVAARACSVSLFLLFSFALSVAAQQTDLEQSRRRLDQIRQQREELERQQTKIEGQVNDVGAALQNIEKQRDATSRLVNGIEHEISGLASQLDHSAAEMILAQDNLADRKAVLQRRLDEIYRRGPLYTVQVLLSAESFGDLLARYKYLYLTSRQDRQLVHDVEQLTANVQRERNKLLGIRDELDQRKSEHQAEMQHYSELAQDRSHELEQLKQNSKVNKRKLTALERDEATVTEVLASLERARRAALAASAARPNTVNAPTPGGLSTADIGRLDWPVDGQLAFNFGPDTLASGGVIRWNGIGIAAPVGTPVKAVASGKVVRVQRLSTYGLGVIIQHDNGYYSLYWQLLRATVKEGETVTRGETIGEVGGQNTDKGPHLYFEIRGDNQIALDPIAWLKSRQ